jgi:hypothetical protein
MKNKILLSLMFVFLSPYVCFSQKIDTIITQIGEYYLVEEIEYHENDSIKSICYKTQSEQALLNPDKLMDYFMRGISINKIGDEFYHTRDSLKSFSESGLLLAEEFYGHKPVVRMYHYDQFMKLNYLEKKEGGETVYESEEIQWNEKFYMLEGRIGANEDVSISLTNLSNDLRKIQMSLSGKTELYEIELKPYETKDAVLKIEISDKEEILTLSLDIERTIVKDIRIKILGYDLTDQDFFELGERQMTYDFIGRSELYIKLEGPEKELRISGEKKDYRQGIARIIEKVDISDYEEGVYLIEIVNLDDNTTRYCRMRK